MIVIDLIIWSTQNTPVRIVSTDILSIPVWLKQVLYTRDNHKQVRLNMKLKNQSNAISSCSVSDGINIGIRN